MGSLDPVDSFIKRKEELLNNDFMQAPLIFEDKFDKTTKVRLAKAIGVMPKKIQIEDLSDFLKESDKKPSFCELLLQKIK